LRRTSGAAKRLRQALGLGAGLAALLAGANRVGAAGEPASRGEAIRAAEFRQLASGMDSIVAIANAGDARVFLGLQAGRVIVFDRTRVLPGAFLDISARGSLLSLAFHPSFASNGFLFISYMDLDGKLVVARYKRAAKDEKRADPGSGVVLLTIPIPAKASRYGGALAFGKDGYLYVGVGDGGSPNEATCAAQKSDSVLGKILRLDVNANSGKESKPGTGLEKVWAKGLRDPRQLSFDRATGDLYIADSGEIRQEIDLQPALSKGGENYGWPMLEGSVCRERRPKSCVAALAPCNSAELNPPILEYVADEGECSEIVGGVVYRGVRFPALAGVYFYGDYCTGQLWGTGQLVAGAIPGLTALGLDANGEIYAGTDAGTLLRMDPPPPPTPTPPEIERQPPVEPEDLPPPREYAAPPRIRPRDVPPAPFESIEVLPTDTPVPTTTPVPTHTPEPSQTPLVVYLVGSTPTDTATPTAKKTRVARTPTPAQATTPEPDRSAPTRVPRDQPPPRAVTPRP